MIVNTVKLLGSRVMPNPIEVDYWIDTRSDPYGSLIKYYNGVEWVPLTQGGSVADSLLNYYTKDEVDSRLNRKPDMLYVNRLFEQLSDSKADKTNVYNKSEIDSMFLNFDAFDEDKYYTKQEIDGKGYLTAIPSIYVTENELNDAVSSFVTSDQLDEKANAEDVYTKGEVDKKITDAVTSGTVDLSNYYTKQEVYSKGQVDDLIPTDIVTQQEFVDGLSSKQDILSAGQGINIQNSVISLDKNIELFQVVQELPIENIDENKIYMVPTIGGENNTYVEYLYADGQWETLGEYKVDIDLSEYALKTDIPSLEGYATQDWVLNKGYLTEHQDLSHLLRADDAAALYQPIGNYLTSVPDEYVTQTELENEGFLKNIPDSYASKDYVDQSVLSKANIEDVYDKATVDQKITDAVTGGTVDLSNYYNKQEVDALIPDVSEFAKVEDIPTVPTNVGAFINDAGYITLNEVPKTDLTEYYNKEQIDEFLNDKANAISVPTKVSELENDVPYLTSHQNISHLATKNEISDMLTKTEASSTYQPIGDYALKSDLNQLDLNIFKVVDSLPTSDILSDKIYLIKSSEQGESNIYTEYTYINNSWEILGEYAANVDLTNYLSKEDAESTYLTITDAEATYVTKEELTINALEEVHISNGVAPEDDSVSLWVDESVTVEGGDYLTKTAADTLYQPLGEYVSSGVLVTALSSKQDVIDDLISIREGATLGATAIQEIPSEYVTETELDNKGYLTSHQDISHLATKEESVSLKFTDVSASSWVSDSTYTDYSYRCDLTCTGVTADDYADVAFSVEQVESGDYAPICETKADVVSIWSAVNTSITVPTIIIVR